MNQETKQQRKIEVKPGTLLNLIADVEAGTYRSPHFQREYDWPKTKVRELFDSIYQEFQIGIFFGLQGKITIIYSGRSSILAFPKSVNMTMFLLFSMGNRE